MWEKNEEKKHAELRVTVHGVNPARTDGATGPVGAAPNFLLA